MTLLYRQPAAGNDMLGVMICAASGGMHARNMHTLVSERSSTFSQKPGIELVLPPSGTARGTLMQAEFVGRTIICLVKLRYIAGIP